MNAGLDPQILLIIVFIGMLAILAVGYMLLGALTGPNRRASQRIDRMKLRWAGTAQGRNTSAVSVRRAAGGATVSGFARLFRVLVPRPDEMRRRLDKTGRNISLNQYIIANVVSGIVVGLIFWLLLDLPSIVNILMGLAGGLGLPFLITGRMIDKRNEKFLKLFPEGIDLIVRGLRSGLPIGECMRTVSQEVSDPVGTEFKKMIDAAQLGRSQDEILDEAAKRIDLQDFNFFVTTLSIQRETGGNLAETLDKLSDILRKRSQMKLKVRAMSSEARASALIIGSLPFVVMLVLTFLNYGYVSTLWTDDRGMIMGVVGLMFIGMGAFMISKMIKFEI